MSSSVQIIGLDIGRGYVKGYTEINEEKKECLFKSVIGEGRNICHFFGLHFPLHPYKTER